MTTEHVLHCHGQSVAPPLMRHVVGSVSGDPLFLAHAAYGVRVVSVEC